LPEGVITIAAGDLPSTNGELKIVVGAPVLLLMRKAKTPLLVATYAR
jgi:hypothetical protein